MKHITIRHDTRGLIFWDSQQHRRYTVNTKGIVAMEEDLEHPPKYYTTLAEEQYFQESLLRDDLDVLIYISNTFIYGVNIMEIKVINNNPMNFRALINGGLELNIHHQDGVKAMPGLPNVKLLEQYWKDGVLPSASENEAHVIALLTYKEPEQEAPKKTKKKKA
ncbi:hypothetical protein OGV37_00245 [Citrobacter sp. Cb010]|uniref:hypothetical protein n=1 Tax=Citrobacter TaxID=544 RepID=UPI002576DE59|nr:MULTISPECIES: hypothetical protein [unclassified Citrobacter]MDM3373326.1 hypothetical protein [Citrobacter sp. Cb010]MDM3460497.1 hypothetical protein [Citrobacter sp. Cb036]